MTVFTPSRYSRLNEAVGLLLFLLGLAVALALASYSPDDPSWNTATSLTRTHNLVGRFGALFADFQLQLLGLSAFLLPLLIAGLGWNWFRSKEITSPGVKIFGAVALWLSVSTACRLAPVPGILAGGLPSSGMAGMIIADYLVGLVNPTGAAILTAACGVIALYLLTAFEVAMVGRWLQGPVAWWSARVAAFSTWKQERRAAAIAKSKQRAAVRIAQQAARPAPAAASTPHGIAEIVAPSDTTSARARRSRRLPDETVDQLNSKDDIPVVPLTVSTPIAAELGINRFSHDDEPPFDLDDAEAEESENDIPIRSLDEIAAAETAADDDEYDQPAKSRPDQQDRVKPKRKRLYRLPNTDLLTEIPVRGGYDSQELKEVAGRIKSKLEEFNVRGSVTQINPGPVVTTFEYKPEAGVKYSRITTLTEDLCLGLQAESVLIERLPGKPTVGIEVPNSKREVISLREILESFEFSESPSRMTIALGKDINGRIKVASLETMPHLLIAGSTGSGKSVMLNAMIMSFLYKATPDEVRMIMVDPKRVELGIYEGIPHLLTPVITEPKKATNALRNAVLEMERRLKLLASQGVRNIDQFNRKVAQLRQQPMNLFEGQPAGDAAEELQPLPYILILIDELADLMMLERANVEECITRLAQMARAVGMHLVLATQRPSVDVITGLIKANFPSRISFRVATRVDSRTVLDSMGAEHLLGKGDMLYLPPGSSRLTRVHGAYVSELETNRVVDFWKEQATPEYDQTFLLTPPSEEDDGDVEMVDGEQDAMYEDAVRCVVEMGKASTSTLQRRLRLGYGRAARILDMMQRDGIIGPPDGSKPREVLKRPDWLREVEGQIR